MASRPVPLRGEGDLRYGFVVIIDLPQIMFGQRERGIQKQRDFYIDYEFVFGLSSLVRVAYSDFFEQSWVIDVQAM